METMTKELFEELKKALGEQNFTTWLAPTRIVDFKDGSLRLQVPSKFFRDWLDGHYSLLIKQKAQEISGQTVKLTYEISGEMPGPVIQPEPPSVIPTRIKKQLYSLDLHPKYNFDRFVVGDCNRFAQAATMAVAQAPAKAYNPLFIYGGVGLGKTHLMQAAARMALDNHTVSQVIYTSSENFTNDFINAIANRTTDKFRRKYRKVDVLIIDDIHFLAGQVRTQEQLFHTFNALWDAHKQIILSSDRPPKEIQDIEERLISRFEWGLVVDLQPPDLETRIAILRKESEFNGFHIPDEIIRFLADRVKSNIRKLEGALIQVASYSSLTNLPLDLKTAEALLNGILDEDIDPQFSIEDIQKRVAEFFDIRIADMHSARRPKSIVLPRQIAMYLSRLMTAASLKDIGEAFGGRDHTTVLHALKTVESKARADKNFQNTVTYLEKKIRQ